MNKEPDKIEETVAVAFIIGALILGTLIGFAMAIMSMKVPLEKIQ